MVRTTLSTRLCDLGSCLVLLGRPIIRLDVLIYLIAELRIQLINILDLYT